MPQTNKGCPEKFVWCSSIPQDENNTSGRASLMLHRGAATVKERREEAASANAAHSYASHYRKSDVYRTEFIGEAMGEMVAQAAAAGSKQQHRRNSEAGPPDRVATSHGNL